jgi:hypothetical protein
MTKYVKIEDGEVAVYPYHLNKLKTDFPEVEWPYPQIPDDFLAAYDVYPVEVQEAPTDVDLRTHIAEPSYYPELVDGQWTITITVRELTDEENEAVVGSKAASNRDERFRRLYDTDWMASSDRTMSPEETAYRQALRDLPETAANWPFLEDEDWPKLA